MEKYPCKINDCGKRMMSMGYCDEHWQTAKLTWTPDEMGK